MFHFLMLLQGPTRLEFCHAEFAFKAFLHVGVEMRCTSRGCLVGFVAEAALEWLDIAVRSENTIFVILNSVD